MILNFFSYQQLLHWLDGSVGLTYWFACSMLVMQLVDWRRGLQLDSKRLAELDVLLESIPDAVFLFNHDGKILECNRVAEELCGREQQQLRGTSIQELNRLLSARDEFDHPVQVPSMGVNRALSGEIVRNVRRVFRHPRDGHTVETVTSASPLRENSGEISGALLIVRDTTELAYLQRRLSDTQRHIEVGQMAAGLAHDFSNVMDTTLRALELLDSADPASLDERRTYIEMIRGATNQGSEIIERVRDYLRTGTDHPRTDVDLSEILRQVLELTRALWGRRKDIQVKTELQQKVPMLQANASDLRRAFTNLIINALEAMPGGGELMVRCEAGTNHILVTISDTGQGIAQEHQKNLFVPYFTTKPEGTGLGLSGAQRIVNNMHGDIRVRTEVGKGTTFTVELPLSDRQSVA